MAKTNEELDALKEKIRGMKDELKELSGEELRAVAGGDGETDCKKITCPKCGSTNVHCYVSTGIYYCRNCGAYFVV